MTESENGNLIGTIIAGVIGGVLVIMVLSDIPTLYVGLKFMKSNIIPRPNKIKDTSSKSKQREPRPSYYNIE